MSRARGTALTAGDLVSPSVATLASLLHLMGEELELRAHEVDWGHDRDLLRGNLAKTPGERVATVSRLRGSSAATRAPPMPDAELDPGSIFEALARHGVRFTLIGGLAGVAHGSSIATFDVDVAYAGDRENLERLAAALHELHGTLRGAPPDLPFRLDAATLASGANFPFETRAGPLDVFADPAGAPSYGELERAATKIQMAGATVNVASLDHLIRMKEAAGRPKDLLMASEYRALSDEVAGREARAHWPERKQRR